MKSSFIKVELHTHSKYSYDCNTSFKEIIEKCLKNDIQALAICDHNEIEGSLRLKKIAPFRVIVGEEILTTEGEIIGLFINKFIPPGLSVKETIKRIHAQGGLTYLPHPFDNTTRKTSLSVSGITKYLDEIDIIEIHNGRTIMQRDNGLALNLANTYQMHRAVGSDAHTSIELGRNILEMRNFDSSSEFLKNLSTAKLHTSHPLRWPFVITKYERFKKRYLNVKTISIMNTSCDLCGGDRFKILYKKRGISKKNYFITDDSYGTHPQIVKCLDCNLQFAAPRDDRKLLIKRYMEFNDWDYEKERETRSLTHQRLVENLSGLYPSKGKVLDVGCATGTLLEVANKQGWDSTGVEPSIWASKVGKKYNLNILQGTLDSIRFDNESFDAITCVDVIEHVSSPYELLSKINRILKPNGLLCLVTPDIGGMVPKILKEKWWHIRPDHIYYFTRETLSLLLISRGYKIVKVNRYNWTFSFDYWISRFKNKSKLIYNLLLFIKKSFGKLTNKPLTLNFHDSLEIYARKI